MVTGQTGVVGLIGHPVRHSLSPVIHNAGFQAAGLDFVYLPFLVEKDRLDEALAGLYSANIQGLNVTVPFKIEVLNYVVDLTLEARKIGAANLLIRGEQGWIGDNTDGRGFVQSLLGAGFNPAGKKALLLGAGGAARAVGFGLLGADIDQLWLTNRTEERAIDLQSILATAYQQKKVSVVEWKDREDLELLRNMDLIINTTTVGMSAKSNEQPVVALDGLAGGQAVVADIVYSPLQTPLILAAKANGLLTVTGDKMLLYQAVISWETWTKQKAPLTKMAQALADALYLAR